MSQTRRTYSVRLTAEGGRQVRAELSSVGQTGERELGRVERASRDASRGMDDLSGRARGLSSAIATWNRVLGVMAAATAATAGLQQAVAAYATFEEGLIAVGKTADLSGSALDGFGSRIEALSHRLPVPTEELLAIAQAAGQLGVKGEENILRFTETVARLGSASNLAGEEGATALARLLNVTGESAASVDILGSVIVALGNNFAATEKEIAHIANEVGRATSIFGVSSAEASALAAAMAALGIQAELGGSSVGKALRAMDTAIRAGGESLTVLEKLTGRTGEQLKKIFAQDATAALQLFLTGLGQVIHGGGDAAAVLDRFGLAGEEILKTLPVMAQRSEEVARALEIAGRETKNAKALTEESEKAFASFNAEMALLKNTLASVARSIGAELAPALEVLSRGLRRLLTEDTDHERFNKLFEERLGLLEQIRRKEAHLGRIGSSSLAAQSISSSLIPMRSRLKEIDADLRRLQEVNIEAERSRMAALESKPQTSILVSGTGASLDPILAQASTRKDRLLEIEKSLQRELFDATHQGVERTLAEHKRLMEELERLKTPDNADRVAGLEDQAIALRDARLAELAAREVEIARQRHEANQRIIEDLGLEREALTQTDRQRYISQALRRLSVEATAEQRQEVERLAGALFDEQQALEAQRTAEEERQRLMERGRALTESLMSAEARHKEEIRELNKLLQEGTISQETFNKAMAQANDRLLDAGTDWSSGVARALRNYAREAEDASKAFETATMNALRTTEDAFTDWVMGREVSFRDLANSIIADMVRITIQQSITAPLADWMGGFFGGGSSNNLFGGLFAQGGVFNEGHAIAVQPFAHGGVVERPTIFPMAHGMGLMGEAGPEAVMPLRRLPNGDLGVQAQSAVASSIAPQRPVEVQIVNVTNPDQIRGLVSETIGSEKDTIVNMVLNALDEREMVVRKY